MYFCEMNTAIVKFLKTHLNVDLITDVIDLQLKKRTPTRKSFH